MSIPSDAKIKRSNFCQVETLYGVAWHEGRCGVFLYLKGWFSWHFEPPETNLIRTLGLKHSLIESVWVKFRLLKSICLKSNRYFIEMTCFQIPVVFYLANPRNQLFIFGIQQDFTIYPVKSIRIFKEIGCFARNLRIWLCLRSFCWYETTLKALFFENDAAL